MTRSKLFKYEGSYDSTQEAQEIFKILLMFRNFATVI